MDADYIWLIDLPGNQREYYTNASLNARFPEGRTLEITP